MIACKLCVMTKGLRMVDPDRPLFETDEALFDHMEAEHHVVVRREGESQEDADRRVLTTGNPCPQCREKIGQRLGQPA